MTAEINLFAKKLLKIRRKQKLKLLSFRILVALILLLTVVMISLSAIDMLIAKENQRLETKIVGFKNKISALSGVESKQVYLLSKLDSFAGLLETHEKHQAITETVFALIPNGTSLKGFEVQESGEIGLSGTVPNFTTLSQLMSRIGKSNDYRLPIMAAKVSKITVDKDGVIGFNIDIKVGVGGERNGQ